ncbi:flippase-like domain-containing protein [Couchioplanes caeruleus]|uniref:lysylphosphatidylglycerol synthase transmembrane domain-containing protein n=1 Tax=Couchioplanes caeruleus TaxID=56438 RepID=UPI0020BD7884|nr:lysylphosphatidylglycerol synthase transmembrane domain-containing protein [Couchioplanes caeruleus]UQU67614.1 flippase-like domain-containing protein [Couchioplanes caeruleus]
MGAGVNRWSRAALVLIAAGLGVWAAVRAAAGGASVTGAVRLIAALPWPQLCGLTVLWLLGLAIHTAVPVAAMPGLTHRRAVMLNLAGSSVAGLLPFGGVAGTALKLTMARSWGHSERDFARFVVVVNTCSVIAKLTLPLAATFALAGSGTLTPGAARLWWLVAIAMFAAGTVLLRALCGRTEPLLRLVSAAARLSDRAGRGWPAAACELLAGTEDLVRRRWASLSGGMAGYWLAQAVLARCCLLAVGLRPAPAVVFAALVAERMMTLLMMTPGGLGGAEAGMVTVLIALGADATRSLAGVLLFRAFVFAAQIPVGAAVILGWWLARRHQPGRTSRPCV